MDSEYRQMLDRLLKKDSSTIISNSSTDHAIPLVEKLFQMAEKNVCIFSGKVDTSVYGQNDVVDAAGSFLVADKGEISIVVQSQADEISDNELINGKDSFINKLRDRYGASVLKRIKLFRAKKELTGSEYHFFIADSKGFRFEPDRTKHEAFASFNNEKISGSLSSIFDTLIMDDASTPITIN